MSIPVFSFVAFSGTGKTTFLEKLIPQLKARGLRVAVYKHDAHEFEIDKKGKDELAVYCRRRGRYGNILKYKSRCDGEQVCLPGGACGGYSWC